MLGMPSSSVWTADQAGVPDPTRPPASVLRSQLPPEVLAAEAASTAASAASAAAAPKPQPSLRLTLIRIDRGSGRGVALIDGRSVAVGERVGGWVVSSIDAYGVTLRGASGVRRLTLLSMKEEEVAAPPPAASRGEKESP